jgi:hypothetical protein
MSKAMGLGKAPHKFRLVLPCHGPLAARRQGKGPRSFRPSGRVDGEASAKNEELLRFRAEAERELELKK